MLVITYARVSTKGQQDRGTSLSDQEKRFTEWIQRSGHVRVRAYAEAMSGGRNMQERTFQGMLDDLPHIGAEALVVDSLDRFTRDKIAGAAITHRLGEMGVKLWELEYSDAEPFDLNVDEHRDYVVQRFSDAEAERRRIKKRQLKRYQEQKQRGAATTNRPAFGLCLAGDRKGHRWLEPDTDSAPIVNEVDRQILAGQSQNKVLQWLKAIPRAWRSRRGLTTALYDRHGAYVAAGVRTPEVQQQLRNLLAAKKQSYGENRSTRSHRVHQMSGLIACRLCVTSGIPTEQALMHGRYIVANEKNHPFALVCGGVRANVRIHKELWVSERKVIKLIVDKLRWLRDERVAKAVYEKWAREPKSDKNAKLRDSLKRQLATYPAKEAALEKRAAFAFDLAIDGGPGALEAKRHLAGVEQERMALEAAKADLAQRLAQIPISRSRAFSWQALQGEAERLFDPVLTSSDGIEAWLSSKGELEISGTNVASIRGPFAKWVEAIGPPQLLRKTFSRKRPQVELFWPYLDKLPNKVLYKRESDQDAKPEEWGPDLDSRDDLIVGFRLRDLSPITRDKTL